MEDLPCMLGLFVFLSESKIPGSVPLLTGIIPAHDDDYMAPILMSILPQIPDLFKSKGTN